MAGRALRVAVVGGSTLLGRELVEEISGSAAAVWDLSLLEVSEEAEGQLASAGDEALVVQSLSAETLQGMDLVFFADEAAVTREYGEQAVAAGALVVDLTAGLGEDRGFLLRSSWLPASTRPDLMTAGVVVPHPAALMLALVAERLGRRYGAVALAATVLEPASQAGSAGVDELHQQAVSLLSFQELPKKVFDAQVAFNVQGALGEESEVRLPETRATIRKQAAALLGAGFKGSISLNLLQAPVFHGYVMSVFVRMSEPGNEESVRVALRGDPFGVEAEAAPSNQAAVEAGEVLISVEMEAGEDRSAWVLMAADNLRLSARAAVAAGLELAALRPTARVQ